jgi:hypothetical protein
LYRADLLDGFSLGNRDFDEWLTGERERLREHAVQLFLRLMERAAATGVEPTIRWALRILAVDPVHEPAHRALMELYTAQGRHDAAALSYGGPVGPSRPAIVAVRPRWLITNLWDPYPAICSPPLADPLGALVRRTFFKSQPCMTRPPSTLRA